MGLAGMMVGLMFAGGCVTAHKPAVMGNKEGSYSAIAFSPDAQQLAAAEYSEAGVVLFDVATRAESAWFAPPKEAKAGRPVAVSYTPHADALAVFLGDDNLTVWNTSTSNLLTCIPARPSPYQVVLSPAGRYLATSRLHRPVFVWEAGSGRKVLELTNGLANIVALAFSPDEECLAVANEENTIRLWSLTTGELLTNLPPQRSFVNAMALANTNGLLAVSDGDVDVWRWPTSEHLQTVPSASLSAGTRTVGILWMLASTLGGRPSGSLEVFGAQPAGSVAFSPDGKYIAIINSAANADSALGYSRKQVRVIEVGTGKELPAVAYGGEVGSVAFSPDGHWLATAGRGVNVWDWRNPKEKTPYAPVVVHLRTSFPTKSALPLIRLPAASVRVTEFLDARPQSSLGERTVFKLKMSDVFPARPVAETLREAVVGVFAGAVQSAGDGTAKWEIAGTVSKFSVSTPASLVSWKIKVEAELEVRVTNALGRTVHSAVYSGQAHRVTYVWPSENLIETTCNAAIQQLLQKIQSDPAWNHLSQVSSGEPHEAF